MELLMGLGGAGAHVIHPRWSEYHRPTATSTMTAQCTVTRPDGPGTTGPGGEWTPPTYTTVYTGPCRVIWRPADVRRKVGEQQLITSRYQVSLRYDTPEILVGDTVVVTASVDAGLIGRRLLVRDVGYESEQWQRNLECVDEISALPELTDQVTIVRAPLITGYGNTRVYDWPTATRTTVDASVEPAGSNESTGGRDEVITDIKIFLPAGTDVVATDRIEWGGETWEVDGTPSRWPDQYTGQPHHVEVRAVLTTGG